MALRVKVDYFDGPAVMAVIGVGEEVRAGQALAAMRKAGTGGDDVEVAYKAFLALHRAGELSGPRSVGAFEAWADGVAGLTVLTPPAQIDQAVRAGAIKPKTARMLHELWRGEVGDEGEAGPRRVG